MWRENKGSCRRGESAEAAPCCKGQAALGLQEGGAGLGGHSVRRHPGCRRKGGVRGSLARVSQTGPGPTSSCLVKGVACALLLVLRDLIPAPGAREPPLPATANPVLCLSLLPGEPGSLFLRPETKYPCPLMRGTFAHAHIPDPGPGEPSPRCPLPRPVWLPREPSTCCPMCGFFWHRHLAKMLLLTACLPRPSGPDCLAGCHHWD